MIICKDILHKDNLILIRIPFYNFVIILFHVNSFFNGKLNLQLEPLHYSIHLYYIYFDICKSDIKPALIKLTTTI